jgi:hypothetical protein
MDPRKEAICNALAAFIRQRPSLEFANYGDAAGYRAEQRRIARDKRDAETLLQAVRWRDGITAEDLVRAAEGAYSGRLTIQVDSASQKTLGDTGRCSDCGRVRIDYCTDQYFPTEYRRAVAAVCASALWDHEHDAYRVEPRTNLGRCVGDALRLKFRKEFGSAMQKRWFD